MCIIDDALGRYGYYDDTGHWQRTKFCFVYCGARCNCGPPHPGGYYNPAFDKRLGESKPVEKHESGDGA